MIWTMGIMGVNHEIKAAFVRMVGEEVESKICSIDEALQISKKLSLDLVEISPNASRQV